MNAQEIFDKVVAHLRKQGHRSIRSSDLRGGSICLYRGPNGDRCAIGCLIEDEEYHPRMEGGSVHDLLNPYGQHLQEVDGLETWFIKREQLRPHEDLLSSLQKIHDGEELVTERHLTEKEIVTTWEPRLQELAVEHGLILLPLA